MPPNRSKVFESTHKNKEQLLVEMRQKRLSLFIQQFEKEAQERLNELEAKLENLMDTVEKAFAVELMKMPPSLKNTLMGDLSEEGVSASEVSIVMKSESREMSLPLRHIPNKKGKSTDSPTVFSDSSQKSSSRPTKGGKGTKRTRTLAGSNSAGNLTASSATVKRTQSLMHRNEQTLSSQKTPKLRSVMSTGDLQCSAAGSAAHITVTTAQGQMVSFSEENKDDINWDLLDDVALCHIQKLTSLMDYLSQKNRCQR